MPLLSPTLSTILAGAVLFLLAHIAALLAASVARRIWRERREHARDRFNGRWEPLLYARMAGEQLPLPLLAPSERLLFISLWLQMLAYVRGEAADRLAETARELRLPQYVLELLDNPVPWKRVAGIQATGALRLEAAIQALLAIVMRNRQRSALAAVRALLQIDPVRGCAGLKYLLGHLEWSPGAMAAIVKAGSGRAGAVLAEQVRTAPPGSAKDLIRLIEFLGEVEALPALRERLLSNRNMDEVAVILHCLGRLGGAEDRLAALAFLGHGNWVIRLQAVVALGLLGTAGDIDRVARLLHDRRWWVRYRAARSLLRLAGGAALARMRDVESNAFAREILDRVLAEEP